MIYGIGIDIVKIQRMKEASEKWGREFFEKILTDNEISYCYQRSDPYTSLAVRFAAKEALVKAVGIVLIYFLSCGKSRALIRDFPRKPPAQFAGSLHLCDLCRAETFYP